MIEKPVSILEKGSDLEFLAQARERAQEAYTYWKENQETGISDLNFLAGDQWDKDVLAKRKLEGNRPCLTINKLPQYVDRVQGEARQNRPGIDVRPVDGNQSNEKAQNIAGTKDYSMAEVSEGILRQISSECDFESHLDRGTQHAIESGFGWLRAYTAYSTDTTFDQDIKLESIKNRFSVLPGPSDSPMFEDMPYCFIFNKMRRKEFDKRYPGKLTGDLSPGTEDGDHLWYEDGFVSVAEYMYREAIDTEILLLSDGKTVWLDDVEKVLDELEADGVTVQRRRNVTTWRVYWCKITAHSVLEKPTEMPCDEIPVVPVLGKELTLDNKTIYKGMFRHAIDAQRMVNYLYSVASEMVSMSPKAPYVGTPAAISGHEHLWKTANQVNHPILLYNEGEEKPTREQPTNMPSAEMALALHGSDLIKETIGMYDAALGNESNETSGTAIRARQQQSSTGAFTYYDNANKAMERIYSLALQMIPKTLDSTRVQRIINVDGTGDWIEINKPVLDEETGEVVVVSDLTAVKCDVVVTAGGNYETRRMEAV